VILPSFRVALADVSSTPIHCTPLAWQQRCRIPGGFGKEAHQFTLRHFRRSAPIRQGYESEQRRMSMQHAFAGNIGITYAPPSCQESLQPGLPDRSLAAW
jgi:hypothetical protein